MTQATGRVFGPKPFAGDDAIAHSLKVSLAAAVSPFKNWLLGYDSSGNLVAMGTNVPNLVSGGFADRDQAGNATAARAEMLVRQQYVSGYPNSSITNDAMLAADVGAECWAADNQTVGKKSNDSGNNRSMLGLFLGIDDDNGTPIVYVGPIGHALARAAHIANNKVGGWTRVDDADGNFAETGMNREKLHGVITGVQLIDDAGNAADNTNYIQLTISKRDGAGGAAVVVATYDSRAGHEGAATAWTPKSFLLSAVAGALNLLETDVLTITGVKAGTGQAVAANIRLIQKVG